MLSKASPLSTPMTHMGKHEEFQAHDDRSSSDINSRKLRYRFLPQGICILILAVLCWRAFLEQRRRPLSHGETPSLAPIDIQRCWGFLSPYHAQHGYEDTPSGCVVNQVNIVNISKHTCYLGSCMSASQTWSTVSRICRPEIDNCSREEISEG